MTVQQKIELVKKLKYYAAFQKDCLNAGDWDDYDKLENEIKKLEETIVYAKNEEDCEMNERPD
ncbi:MAG: hypothetical protein P4L62_04715 [Candidatus Pacebacteria bacterium]|nr:hypothetical protein [Candidatus Paceibacterota bacterium]MDR3583634.1 hypothetical protein [Candidatus Paceibacterota bacterium]